MKEAKVSARKPLIAFLALMVVLALAGCGAATGACSKAISYQYLGTEIECFSDSSQSFCESYGDMGGGWTFSAGKQCADVGASYHCPGDESDHWVSSSTFCSD